MILKSYVDALISSPKLQSCAHFKQPSWSVKPVSRRQQTENVNQPRPSVTKANTINCEQMSYFAPCGLIKLPVIYLPYYLIQRSHSIQTLIPATLKPFLWVSDFTGAFQPKVKVHKVFFWKRGFKSLRFGFEQCKSCNLFTLDLLTSDAPCSAAGLQNSQIDFHNDGNSQNLKETNKWIMEARFQSRKNTISRSQAKYHLFYSALCDNNADVYFFTLLTNHKMLSWTGTIKFFLFLKQ